MLSKRLDIEMSVETSEKTSIGFPPGFPAHCAGRLAPLALDNAKYKIDPTMLSVTLGGLSQEQIDAVDFTSVFTFERFHTAIRTLFAGRR